MGGDVYDRYTRFEYTSEHMYKIDKAVTIVYHEVIRTLVHDTITGKLPEKMRLAPYLTLVERKTPLQKFEENIKNGITSNPSACRYVLDVLDQYEKDTEYEASVANIKYLREFVQQQKGKLSKTSDNGLE